MSTVGWEAVKRKARERRAAAGLPARTAEQKQAAMNGLMTALARRHWLSAEDLATRHRRLPRVDAERMRREADEFFGSEDRVGDDDPWEHTRG